jgi:hypothetical protein
MLKTESGRFMSGMLNYELRMRRRGVDFKEEDENEDE